MTLEEFNNLYYNPIDPINIENFRSYDDFLLFKECLKLFNPKDIYFQSTSLLIIQEDFFVEMQRCNMFDRETYQSIKNLYAFSNNKRWVITHLNKNRNLLYDMQLIKFIKNLTEEQINELKEAMEFLMKMNAIVTTEHRPDIKSYKVTEDYYSVVWNLNLSYIEKSLETFYVIKNTINRLRFNEIIKDGI